MPVGLAATTVPRRSSLELRTGKFVQHRRAVGPRAGRRGRRRPRNAPPRRLHVIQGMGRQAVSKTCRSFHGASEHRERATRPERAGALRLRSGRGEHSRTTKRRATLRQAQGRPERRRRARERVGESEGRSPSDRLSQVASEDALASRFPGGEPLLVRVLLPPAALRNDDPLQRFEIVAFDLGRLHQTR